MRISEVLHVMSSARRRNLRYGDVPSGFGFASAGGGFAGDPASDMVERLMC